VHRDHGMGYGLVSVREHDESRVKKKPQPISEAFPYLIFINTCFLLTPRAFIVSE
jgi:hypothetical protein